MRTVCSLHRTGITRGGPGGYGATEDCYKMEGVFNHRLLPRSNENLDFFKLTCVTNDTGFIFTKGKCCKLFFFYISKAEIAQFCQKLQS